MRDSRILDGVHKRDVHLSALLTLFYLLGSSTPDTLVSRLRTSVTRERERRGCDSHVRNK